MGNGADFGVVFDGDPPALVPALALFANPSPAAIIFDDGSLADEVGAFRPAVTGGREGSRERGAPDFLGSWLPDFLLWPGFRGSRHRGGLRIGEIVGGRPGRIRLCRLIPCGQRRGETGHGICQQQEKRNQ
ncbi:MAG: hypothetical protein EBT95_04195 [Verrucomicrobia bacterium]|nr:hypothetical protein [Verrucomicrobiota bacterium]